jgi:DNA-binding IclR family transcriptional regulator
MLTTDVTSSDWLEIIRAEYLEIPGLNLTKPQIQRLWGLDAPTCDALLDSLVEGGFLRRTSSNVYVRVDLGV